MLILTTEVARALENLSMILAHTSADELAEELRTEVEVFLGFGELLEISEFVAIAQTTLTCLQVSPQAAQTIGQLALSGLRGTYEAILKKDFFVDIAQQLPEAKLAIKDKEISHGFVLPPSVGTAPTTKVDPVDVASSITAVFDLKLKTSNLFVWVAGSTVFTLNSKSVEEILIPEADQIIRSKRQRFLHWRSQMIGAYQISELVSYTDPLPQTTSFHVAVISLADDEPEPMLVLSLGQQILALKPEIEYLVTEPELVIQPFRAKIALPGYVLGCTIWKDRLFQVIDVAALLGETIGGGKTIPATAKLSHSPQVDLVDTPASKITPLITTVTEPTVLVVDDSKSVQQILSLTLQRAGYQVLQAQDGLEAIAQLQHSRVQLVICDIEMPNLNGFEFLSQRLKDPMLAKVPVVMLSSCSSNKHQQLAMQLGAVAHFRKPYVEQEFLAALKAIVERNSNNLSYADGLSSSSRI